MNNQIFRQNIFKGYIYTFASYFGITSLWVIYLRQQGLSLLQIGLCESIFHVASFIFEVPSGILADRFKYKTVLIVGRLAAIVSALMMLLAHHFFFFVLSFIFSAWSYNLQSGTIDALMYESLDTKDRKNRYAHVISISNSLIEAASTSGAMLAALFVHWQFQTTYWIAILCALIAGWAAMSMQEPLLSGLVSNRAKPRVWEIIKPAAKLLHEAKYLQHLIVIQAIFASACTCYYYYFQSLMSDDRLNSLSISILMLFSAVANIAAVQLTPYLQRKFSQLSLIFGLSGLLIASLLLTFINWLPALIAFYLIVASLSAATEPIFSSFYNQLIPSAQRATLLSAASMFFSLAMVAAFPLIGYLIQLTNFSIAFSLLGLLLAGLLFWESFAVKKIKV